jgi:hypothetical protein
LPLAWDGQRIPVSGLTIHVLLLVPVFFAVMKERALRRGTLQPSSAEETE